MTLQTVSDRGVGLYRSSQTHRAMWRRFYRPMARKGVILCPGWNGTADQFYTDGADQLSLISPILDSGFSTASRDDGSQWGNSESRSRITDLKAYAHANFGFQFWKVHILGLSAGSLAALRWTMANARLVQSLTLLLPAVDPQDIYDRDPLSAGIAASISTAYGGRPADSESPIKNPSAFAGVPIKMWYSANDPICLPAKVTSFASAVGSNVVTELLPAQSGGFTPGHSINGLDHQELADWINLKDRDVRNLIRTGVRR